MGSARIPPRAYELLRAVAVELDKTVEEVVEEILEGIAVRFTKEEVVAYLSVVRRLGNRLRALSAELGKLREELARLGRRVDGLESRLQQLEAMLLGGTRVPGPGCLSFVAELASHGLLGMVRRWLLGEHVETLHLLMNDDAFYTAVRCRDEVLSSRLEDSGEPRRLEWVC